MTNPKAVWRNFLKYFSKSEDPKNGKLRYNAKSTSDMTEDDFDFQSNPAIKNVGNSSTLKRHQTCSIDLSNKGKMVWTRKKSLTQSISNFLETNDKTYRPKNRQELSNIESTSPLPRTNSFNLNIDFPKKLLPISDFEEKEVLGQGAFGRAIKVQSLKTGAYFVMKEVVSHSKENEESLIKEVSLLRSLKHDNILTCLGLVLKEKRICLLTELMHGGSLQSKIQDLEQIITVHQKILFLRDIAAGMNFLHQNSIMHRDLTSSNCLLRKNNTVVISDFGLSKFLNPDFDGSRSPHLRSATTQRCSSSEILNEINSDSNLRVMDLNKKLRNFLSVENISFISKERHNTIDDDSYRYDEIYEKRRSMNLRRKHTVVGNPFWMAPEMLAGKTYNCLVDLYSFGIIGCEVTARISAYPEFLERHNKDMSVNFKDFIEKNQDKELINCPEELIDIVEKCCKSDPDKRPTFNNILSWLEDILFRISNNLQLKIKSPKEMNYN